jgi:dihydroorotate dehydrogenase
MSRLAYGLTATLGGLFGYSYISDTRAGVYPGIILPALRLILDAEQSHALGIWLCKHNLVPKSKIADPPNTSVTIWGRRLSNPIGIAAGFDKNGEAINALFGFGFANVEIGSITPESQVIAFNPAGKPQAARI